jgi:hypothetical protein
MRSRRIRTRGSRAATATALLGLLGWLWLPVLHLAFEGPCCGSCAGFAARACCEAAGEDSCCACCDVEAPVARAAGNGGSHDPRTCPLCQLALKVSPAPVSLEGMLRAPERALSPATRSPASAPRAVPILTDAPPRGPPTSLVG